MVFFQARAFAVCDYMDRCPAGNPDLASEFTQFFSNATGSTFLIEQIVQNIIKSELKKATEQDFEVVLKAFSLNDLFAGRFKSLEISGSNVVVEGIHLSAVKIRTLCGYNNIDLRAKPIAPRENMVLGVSAEMTAEDLRNSIAYKNYSKEVSKVDLSDVGIRSFRVYDQTIGLDNNKLYFTINATPNGPYRPLDISICADINVKEGRIIKSRFNFVNLYSGFDVTQVSNLMNSLNNLNFSLNLFGKKSPKAEVQIMNVEILGDRVFLSGLAFVPKSLN